MKVPIRIYYDIQSGRLIQMTGNYSDNFITTYETVEEQILKYRQLSERNRETFDYIELPFGSYAQDFRDGRLVGVNSETKEPVFEYPNPEEPSEPIVPDKPLSVQIEDSIAYSVDLDFRVTMIELGLI